MTLAESQKFESKILYNHSTPLMLQIAIIMQSWINRVYAQSTIYPRKRNFYIVTLVWRFHYNGRFPVAPYTRRIISRGLPRLTPTQVYFINYHWFLHFGIIIVDCRHFQPLGCIVAAVFWPRRSGSYKLRILRLIWTSSDIFSYNNTLNILMHNICA